MNTLIEKVVSENLKDEEQELILDENNMDKYIMNFSISQNIRIKALELYYSINNENTIELISRITGMYQFSGTKILQNFLTYICIEDVKISTFLKFECAKSLLSFYEFEEDILKDDEDQIINIKNESNNNIKERNLLRKQIGYKCIYYVCKLIVVEKDFPTPCKIEAFCMLMEVDTYKDETDLFFRDIINDDNLSCQFRYKTILFLEKEKGVSSNEIKLLNTKFYIKNSCVDFIYNTKNEIMYRILAGQYLLQNYEIDKEDIYKILYEIALNKNTEYNLKADAADTLLSLGSDEYKEKARNIINDLGNIDGNIKNIYNNAQNVHSKQIESSVKEVLDFLLANTKVKIIDDKEIDFQHVSNIICELIKDFEKEKKRKIKTTLNRIFLDRALYSKFNNSLSNILVRLWSYIQENEYKESMLQRLLEEMEDMSGTCSSGFLSRLVNTLSGFGELNVRISFDDQLISNFTGRLNMYARKITDDCSPFRDLKLYDVIELYIYSNCITSNFKDIKNMKELINKYLEVDREKKINIILENFEENVLNEMMLETNKFNDRRHFLIFFREYMLRIREELYEEFKDYMTDTEFDLCFRKAISTYEGVQNMI